MDFFGEEDGVRVADGGRPTDAGGPIGRRARGEARVAIDRTDGRE